MPLPKSTANHRPKQIARPWPAFQQAMHRSRAGSVNVTCSAGITLGRHVHGRLSPAEAGEWAQTPRKALPKVRSFHRQFVSHRFRCPPSGDQTAFTRVDVHDASVEMKPAKGTVFQVFPNGTHIQVLFVSPRPLPPGNLDGDGKALRNLSDPRLRRPYRNPCMKPWASHQHFNSDNFPERKFL